MTTDPHEQLEELRSADEVRLELAKEIKAAAEKEALARPMPTRTEEYSYAMMKRLSKDMTECDIFGLKDDRAAFALMLVCREDGISPVRALQEYHFIQGKPALRADAMLRRFQQAGGKVQYIKHNDKECEMLLTAPDGTTLQHRWTMEDATRAGLAGKGIWKQFPKAMLRNRCLSEGIRSLWPAVLGGMYEATEVAGFADKGKPVAQVPAAMEEDLAVQENVIDVTPAQKEEPRGEERAAQAAVADAQADREAQAMAEADEEDGKILMENIDACQTTDDLDAIFRDIKGIANEELAAQLEDHWNNRVTELVEAAKKADAAAKGKADKPKPAAAGKKLTAAEQKLVDSWVTTLTTLAQVQAQVPEPFEAKVSELHSTEMPEHVFHAIVEAYDAKAGEGAPSVDVTY